MRVLAAVDIRDHSHSVVKTATTFTLAVGGTLDLVYASSDLAQIPMSSDSQWAEVRAAERRDLEALRDALPDAIRGSARVLVGNPSEVLPAATWDYDLMVMATHGRSGLKRLMVGSVTEAVLRQAHCPVMTVRIADSSS